MKKLAIYQHEVVHYRVDLFNQLAKDLEVTVLFSATSACLDELSPAIRRKKIKRLRFVKLYFLMFPSFLKGTPILMEGDIKVVNLLWGFGYDIIPWGLWNTNSMLGNYIRYKIFKNSRKSVFYCREHMYAYTNDWSDSRSKAIVAKNTVVSKGDVIGGVGGDIFFIGSLNARKRLSDLVSIMPRIPESTKLHIIGDGQDKQRLVELCELLNLKDRVIFYGALKSRKKIFSIANECCVSVSPGQAGLSVLHSLGMGLPFVCYFDAISGGEKYNIVQGITGYRVMDIIDLENILRKIVTRETQFDPMTILNYIEHNCSGKIWTNAIKEIIP